MAWEWSHTSQAECDAYDNVHTSPRDFLIIALAEWHQERRLKGTFSEARYRKSIAFISKLPTDVIADSIWAKASTQRTCDNGGFNAYICPFGCHAVPFSCEEIEAR